MIMAASIIVAAPVVQAQPGFFYVFEKADTKEKVCQPAAPGTGWTQVAGPFEDSDCAIPVKE
jgi:hypothetical protein